MMKSGNGPCLPRAPLLIGALSLTIIAGLPLGAAPLAAPNIGVAAAVLPDATGTRPNQAARVLRIGVDIVADERVVTDAKGKLQLLFLDGSALTMGPNSDVVVDRFIYDPAAKTGDLAFSATKGVFRLVGGRISKKKAVILKLPTAVIGIRGGIATVNATDAGVTATFIFGEQMSLESGGVSVAVTRPGFQVSAEPGQPPSAPVPVSEQQIANELNALESSQDQADEGEVQIGDEDVANTQLAALGSDDQSIQIASSDRTPLGEGGETNSNVNEGTDTTTASQQLTTESAAPAGLTLTGFNGRGKRSTSTATGTLDANSTQNLALSGISIAGGRFSVSTSQGDYNLFFPATTGAFTLEGDNSTPFGNVTGSGLLSDDEQFVLYELFGSRQLVFAGVPTPASAVPTSGVTTYNPRDDFALGGSKIPFVSFDHGGILTPLVPAKAMIYWGASGSGAQPTFFAGNLAISGTGSNQTHAVSLLVGEIETDSLGRPFMSGEGVATALTTATGDYYFSDAEIATQDDGAGNDFFGTGGPNYAVLGAESVNSLDVIDDRGFEEGQRNTETLIFPNVVLSATTSTTGLGSSRTTRVLAAYVGGISRDFNSSNSFLGAHLFRSINTTTLATGTTDVNGDPAFVNRIQTSAANNTVEGAFRIQRPSGFSHGVPDTTLDFGGLSITLSDQSSFIDDSHFGAIGFESGTDPDADIGMFRNTDISLAAIAPSGVTICTCAFVTWGFWGAVVEPSTEHDIGLATWVAGERFAPTSPSTFSATGSYSGTLLASVANGPHETNGSVGIYTAVGTYSYDLSISNGAISVSNTAMSIDGASLTFSGTGSFSSAPTEFSGTVSGTRGALSLSGTIRGAFFGAPSNASSPPQNVAGTFYAHDSAITYQISGVHFSEVAP
jgi:hypothetical protein